MDRDTYESLIGRLEVEAANNPAVFRSKVLLISSAAYVILFVALTGLAILIYLGLSWAYETHNIVNLLKIGIFGLVMAPVFFVVLRAFFTRLEPPQGRRITRHEAPKLFGVLDDMRKKLKGPPIHHVLVDSQYNAAISQVPKWGLFGGHTNYLILGLPYLLGVPMNEMLATVAHEYGHLCGSHGKLGAWVYRQRRTFGALYEKLEASAGDNPVQMGMIEALKRFMPYYNAYTFVMARQNEYEADKTATDLVGAEANASGLIRDTLLARWIHEEFWPKLFKQADIRAQPTFMPFSGMRIAFNAAYERWAKQEWLEAAWCRQSDLHDTHPALRERVQATGQSPSLPARAENCAAQLLGEATANALVTEFDQAWWTNEKKSWASHYHHATHSKARLQALTARPLDALSTHELHELALLKMQFDGGQAAKPLLERLLNQTGGPFPKASYYYGRILLDENNGRGLDHLMDAVSADKDLADQSARAGYTYLLTTRGKHAALDWWNKIVAKGR